MDDRFMHSVCSTRARHQVNRETTWDVPLSHPIDNTNTGCRYISLVYEHHERNYVLQLICTSDKLCVMEVQLMIKILLLTFIVSSAATRGNSITRIL